MPPILNDPAYHRIECGVDPDTHMAARTYLGGCSQVHVEAGRCRKDLP